MKIFIHSDDNQYYLSSESLHAMAEIELSDDLVYSYSKIQAEYDSMQEHLFGLVMDNKRED